MAAPSPRRTRAGRSAGTRRPLGWHAPCLPIPDATFIDQFTETNMRIGIGLGTLILIILIIVFLF
jgi:hypothetical protein